MTPLRLAVATGAALLVVAAVAGAAAFPDTIALPTGFQPEGIAVGNGHTFYVGSIPTGAIYRGDLRTGEGAVFVPAAPGRAAIGLKYDRGRLFVAGGPTGRAFVYDARTGALLAEYVLDAAAPRFINDVVVTKDAAWFTNSPEAVVYRLPLGPGGSPPPAGAVETVPLGGDFVLVPGQFNANGIAATPNGKWLLVVNSFTGSLFRVDPETGVADRIELTGGDVRFGDGILLAGKTLYVVQNQLDRVAVVELAPDLSSGTIVGHITDDDLVVPTTIARFGNRLYAVNAKFNRPNPTNAFEVVRLPKR